MLKTLREKITLTGMAVLGVGAALLIFTFISAYGFLTQSLSIIATEDLIQTFGAALAPLIITCIRLMYLGVMGWVGSLLTIRGVTILVHAPKVESVVPVKTATPQQLQQKAVPTAKKAAPEPKKEHKEEPEVIVIPPEQQVQKTDLQSY